MSFCREFLGYRFLVSGLGGCRSKFLYLQYNLKEERKKHIFFERRQFPDRLWKKYEKDASGQLQKK